MLPLHDVGREIHDVPGPHGEHVGGHELADGLEAVTPLLGFIFDLGQSPLVDRNAIQLVVQHGGGQVAILHLRRALAHRRE